jgi:cysteine synthase A
MIEDLERQGLITTDTHSIIESSSGSLGVALSLVCRVKGYRFTCVTDPNITPACDALMRAYGSEVVVVRERDQQGGFLGTRLQYISDRLREDRGCFWPNQYANWANPLSHYHWTARQIHREFPDPDFIFIGAGTTGTLVGCARYFARHNPRTRIVAVDAAGSVTFGYPAGRRALAGLGTSCRPGITSTFNVADIVLIPEWRTVEVCKAVLERYGFLIGASTGTVLAAVQEYGARVPPGASVVVVSPDLGERYASTVYDPSWTDRNVEGANDSPRICLPGRPADARS